MTRKRIVITIDATLGYAIPNVLLRTFIYAALQRFTNEMDQAAGRAMGVPFAVDAYDVSVSEVEPRIVVPR